MILLCCSICEREKIGYCVALTFALHLLSVIIFATMATTTPTNRTSFYLIIYFDVSLCINTFFLYSIVLYHTFSNNNSFSLCVYEIFTLTLAFVSRWHYFSLLRFSSSFYILHLARIFPHLVSLVSKFSMFIRSALLANPFFISLELVVY